MWNFEDEYPAPTAETVTNPDSSRLVALLSKTDEGLDEKPVSERNDACRMTSVVCVRFAVRAQVPVPTHQVCSIVDSTTDPEECPQCFLVSSRMRVPTLLCAESLATFPMV